VDTQKDERVRGNTTAMKYGGHFLKGLNQFSNCLGHVPEFHIPLCVQVDYRGAQSDRITMYTMLVHHYVFNRLPSGQVV
jgi:hypothetical protein